jgi:hypothetical protein
MRELPLDILKKVEELKELCRIRGYKVDISFEKLDLDFWELWYDTNKPPMRNEDLTPYN